MKRLLLYIFLSTSLFAGDRDHRKHDSKDRDHRKHDSEDRDHRKHDSEDKDYRKHDSKDRDRHDCDFKDKDHFSIDTFSPDLVRYVTKDRSTHNLLFHGDIPRKENGKFDRDGLIKALKDAYPKKFPKHYILVVLSHLTLENQQEEDFLIEIYAYFNEKDARHVDLNEIVMQTEYSSRKGIWYWWQVRAHVPHSPPFDENVSWKELDAAYDDLGVHDVQTVLLDQSFNGIQLNFVDCVDTIHALLKRDASKPLVIYVHSRRGFNRNGASLAAYLMKYEHQSIERAWNNILEHPNLIYEQQEMKSYLYYYKAYLELF